LFGYQDEKSGLYNHGAGKSWWCLEMLMFSRTKFIDTYLDTRTRKVVYTNRVY